MFSSSRIKSRLLWLDNITLCEEGGKSEQKRVFLFVFFKSDYIKN